MNMVIINVDFLCGVVLGMSSRYELMNYQLRISHMRFALWVVLDIVLLPALYVGCCFHGCIEIFV